MYQKINIVSIDFKKIRDICKKTKEDVIPVVVQDVITKDVLVLAYINEKALEYTMSTGMATFWSTSRDELWVKGLTSGNILKLVDIRVNCERNSLLYLVEIKEGCGACHKKDGKGKYRKSCYFRKLKKRKEEEKC